MANLIKYSRGTKYLSLILSVDNSIILKFYIYGSYAVQTNTRGKTGGGLTIGQGLPILASIKQNINNRSSRSSTESEIFVVDQLMPSVLWTRICFEAQVYGVTENIVYQDKKSAILLEKNVKSFINKRTERINIIYIL